MPALHLPTAFIRGDTWEISGSLFYADCTPFNLNTGCSVAWTLADSNSNLVLELSLAGGIVVENPAGIILITVTPAQSSLIAPGEYTDQLRATDVSGFVSTQWLGAISVRPSLFTP